MKVQRNLYEKGRWREVFDSNLDSENTLVLLFFDPQIKNLEEIFHELKEIFKKSTVGGCSTSGEIYDDSVYEKSVSCLIIQFEKSKFKMAYQENLKPEDSFECGRSLSKKLIDTDLKGVLILSEGLTINGSELVRGFSELLPKEVQIFGGLAGDGIRFQKTKVITEDKIESGYVCAFGLYGDSLKICTGSFGGWDEFGPSRMVTKSVNNVLFELDGVPSLQVYKEYLGSDAKLLPSSALLFPLSITTDERKGIVRTILGVDESNQSMTFAGDIPKGARAQLMRANLDRLILGAQVAGKQASSQVVQTDLNTVCLAISCVGRKIVLGEKSDEETIALKSCLPKDTTQVGFYSYGEISTSGVLHCELHNQTMTVALIQEE